MRVETINLRWNSSSQRLEEEGAFGAFGVRSSERFLQLSQVPLDWLEKASRLPGRALAVGLAIWALSIAVKQKTVMVTPMSVEGFGVDTAAKSRALAALVKAGLLSMESRRGKFPLVTLLVSDEE